MRDLGEERREMKKKSKERKRNCALRYIFSALFHSQRGRRERCALLGNAKGTWGPGGSEWMTKFGLKGHANIHLLPAIKQATQ